MDSKTTITIEDEKFEVAADDLEVICLLGRGAYGVVEKMRHRPSDTILAVKVPTFFSGSGIQFHSPNIVSM